MPTFDPLRSCLLVALLLSPLLGGCTESSLSRPGMTQVLFQSPPTEVDILLVVDDSCSMEDEQNQLSEGFDRFVEFFDVADVDYHIGVTTTDIVNSPGALVDGGGHKIITRDTPDASEVFRENVRVGIEGSAYEKGLDAASAALTTSMLDGANAGFLREDAYLSIIFISDEEDSSEFGVNTYINHFFSLKGQRSRDVFNASAMVGVDVETGEPSNCGQSGSNPNAGAVAAHRYHDVAQQTGGVIGSICSDSDTFADIVSQMGLASSRLLDSFLLERRPREESLELTLFVPGTDSEDDGETLPPEGDAEGSYPWVYEEDEDAQEWRIRFTDIDSLPPIDTRITVHYELF